MKSLGDEAAPLVEPVPVIDVFATDIARIETIGGCLRFVIAAEQVATDGGTERTVVGKVVIPMEKVAAAIGKLVEFVESHPRVLATEPDEPHTLERRVN